MEVGIKFLSHRVEAFKALLLKGILELIVYQLHAFLMVVISSIFLNRFQSPFKIIQDR